MNKNPKMGNQPGQPDEIEQPRLWSLPLPLAGAGQTEIALRERVKELNCLYGITRLAEKHQTSLDGFLQDLVKFLPPSWQYAEHTCAKIIFEDRIYLSQNFKETTWQQTASIYLNKTIVGECSIYYTSECPPADEGPFLQEERELLNAVAEKIGSIAGQIFADLELQELNQQLKLERQALRETNTALKVILSRNELEQQEAHSEIQHNVEKILLPIIDSMAIRMPPSQKKYAELLKVNLTEILSPFMGNISKHHFSMSPTELLICNMIRNGMTSKEIAEIRGVSRATIHHHREKIRRKLGISNKDVNLVSYLQHNLNEIYVKGVG